MTDSNGRLLDILSFWHRIEFFVPFDLENRTREADHRKSLWRARGDRSSVAFHKAPKEKEVAGYTLFLGVFDKGDVQDVAKNQRAGSEMERLDDEQRGDLEGLTCMASIELTADARPLFDTVAVSTLPWAVGQVRGAGLAALSSAAFSEARGRLAGEIANFSARRHDPETPDEEIPPLRPDEIGQLLDLFCSWAGFRPEESQPEAVLEIRFRKKRARHVEAESPKAGIVAHVSDDEEEEADEVDQQDVGILNSFYIDDIEQAMASVMAGTVPDTLLRYLTPLPEQERIDLYTKAGRKLIVEELAPERMNRGRWIADPTHAMSLMQQFAINTGMARLAGGGLHSVNGPPGTGKTTLLRDIFAENIVRRARVLAGLKRAGDAFRGKAARPVANIQGKISHLIPELTGYEMVVASTNNTAVENISRDLPKRKFIHDLEFGYLQPVAHKVAAQDNNGRCNELHDDDRPWGLIACALGKSANRSKFVDRLFWNKIREDAPKTWSGSERPQTLWEWRDRIAASPELIPSFKEARQQFKDADAAVESSLGEMEAFLAIHKSIAGQTRESFCAPACRELDAARVAAQGATKRREAAARDVLEAEERLAALREEERLLGLAAPAWWAKLLGSASARQHRLRVQANAEAQINQSRVLRERKAAFAEAETARTTAHAAEVQARKQLAATEARWDIQSKKYQALLDHFGAIMPPEDLADLESDQFQKQGLWHSQELARLRSDLFKAALRLHEAWLAEVSVKGGGFGANLSAIGRMLQGQPVEDEENLLSLWQSLFMVVPVVSTTFASFGRQFRGMGPASLGWLFIDEAGQAVPQAAVGALLRAKRALVIGDPLQIEPVFTVSKNLISNLAELSPHTSGRAYSPDKVSVQVLADLSNPYGAAVQAEGDETLWIGSPLRVHRRCLDPMFSLANSIAYENKMVFGLDERLPDGDAAPFYGDTAWINLPGQVSGRQSVPEQIDFIADLMVATHARFGNLPQLYVISPFKEVRDNLVQALRDRRWSSADRTKPEKFERWLSAHIGTVHTFQGKEEDTVIMVLGADARHEGAARWAALKPNLLNVALTRAKRRFHMVGDVELWGKQRFFSEPAQDLPVMRKDEFMRRLHARWAELGD